MIQSLFEFFQAFAASILSAIGIPLSFTIPVSKMLAVVAMFVTAVYLLRLTARLYASLVDTLIRISTASNRLKQLLNRSKPQSREVESPKDLPPVALGAALGLALKRLSGQELETLQSKSTTEIVQFLDEKFGDGQEPGNWKSAKIDSILAKF